MDGLTQQEAQMAPQVQPALNDVTAVRDIAENDAQRIPLNALRKDI